MFYRLSTMYDKKNPNTVVDSHTDQAELARLCKALAHPARIRIVQYLRQMEQCVCGQIVDQLPLAQSTVSQHLRALKEAGLIQGQVDGPRTCYCLDPAAVQRLKQLIENML
jgi:ArsR family transcriptional regulator